jgi:UDP-glucose 4-epimerase
MNSDTARVLVTGAHGFIGRHAARHFARHGHTVTGMGHGGWKVDEWRSWGLSHWQECDISLEALERHANKPDVILHCAGSGSVAFSMGDPLADFHRTVTTTANVMEYIRKYSPSSRIVYPSSASVYGVADTLPIREDSRCAPISPYGLHKLFAEQIIVSHSRHFEIAASVIRFFSVYGCGLKKQLLWDGCRKLAGGERTFMGTGDEIRDWLHVDDATALLYIAADQASPECPIANGGTGEGVSVRELLTHIAARLRPGCGEPVFSESLRKGDPSAYVADIGRANRWGWKPGAHWRDRVSEYVDWWQLEMGAEPSDSSAARH